MGTRGFDFLLHPSGRHPNHWDQFDHWRKMELFEKGPNDGSFTS